MSARLTLLLGYFSSSLRTTDLRATDIPDVVRKAKPAVAEIITTDARGNVASS